MLQRIQSIWLLLAAACAFLGLQFPFYTGTREVAGYVLKGTESIPIIIITVAVGILALVSIFLYNNRKLQLRLTLVGLLLQAVLIFLYYSEVKKFTDGTYALSALLQGCVVLFLFLAAKGINHDNRIIRESNRLR